MGVENVRGHVWKMSLAITPLLVQRIQENITVVEGKVVGLLPLHLAAAVWMLFMMREWQFPLFSLFRLFRLFIFVLAV